MNLYLVEIEGLGIFSVVANDDVQCKELILLHSKEEIGHQDVVSGCIDDAIETAKCFPLDKAANWEIKVKHFC